MAEQVKIDTPAAETKVETPVEKPAEKPAQQTAGEIIEAANPTEKKPETVGLDKFLDLKNENKDLKKAIKDLEKRVDQGATTVELSDDIAAIGDEFDVDKTFLAKLTKAIRSQVESAADEKIKPLQKKERDDLIDKAFTKHYTEAIETIPEYKDIANPEVIKALSLLPANSKKTFVEIIEETYGKVNASGRRTIETTRPGGGKEPQPLDVARARKDTEYFKEVMADPKLKAEYNAIMLKTRM